MKGERRGEGRERGGGREEWGERSRDTKGSRRWGWKEKDDRVENGHTVSEWYHYRILGSNAKSWNNFLLVEISGLPPDTDSKISVWVHCEWNVSFQTHDLLVHAATTLGTRWTNVRGTRCRQLWLCEVAKHNFNTCQLYTKSTIWSTSGQYSWRDKWVCTAVWAPLLQTSAQDGHRNPTV